MKNLGPARTPVRPAAPALAAAGLLGGFLLWADIVRGALSAVMTFAYGGPGAGILGGGMLELGRGYVFFALLVAAGVFLSIWLLAPIVPALPLRQVILRGVLAAAVAAAGQLAVELVADTVGRLLRAGPLFGNSFPDLGAGGWGGIGSVSGAVSVFLSLLPAVVLSVVLLWLWQRRTVQRAGGTDPDAAEGDTRGQF